MMTELAPQDAEGSYNRPKYDFAADPIASMPVVASLALHLILHHPYLSPAIQAQSGQKLFLAATPPDCRTRQAQELFTLR